MKTSKPLLTLRMLFPAAASFIVLLLGEWIARGSLTADTFISFIFPHFGAYLLAWLLLFLVWELLDWVLRIPPLATLGMAVLGCAPCAVNFYTMQLRGEPFLPWDLMQVSEAAGVASAAGLKLQTSMVVSIVLVLALTVASFFVYRGRLRQRWLPRLAGTGASAAALCLLIFGVYLQPAVTQVLGITPDAWMQDRYYRYYGVLTGFMTNLTNLEIDKPEGYSEQAVDDILDNVAESEKFSTGPMYAGSYAATTPKEEQAKQPTIIYVMDESYWDVSELEQCGITFDTDVSQNLHALQQTSAYGRAYSPSFGGGTCDVEFEALTGYSVSFLPSGSKPYQQHVTKPMFALPNYLKLKGYQTAAVHCFWAKYWSRDKAYPNLGFSDFISLEDMHGVTKVRKHYWTSGLVTDDSMADQIIQQYEKMSTSSDKPIFLHAVTMQNHTNYNRDNYPDDERVHVVSHPVGLKSSTVGALEDFATGIRDADAMLGKLTAYFSQVDEPVILVFWGDHAADVVELQPAAGGLWHHCRLRYLPGDDGAVRAGAAAVLPVPQPAAAGCQPQLHPRHHHESGWYHHPAAHGVPAALDKRALDAAIRPDVRQGIRPQPYGCCRFERDEYGQIREKVSISLYKTEKTTCNRILFVLL